MRFFNPGQEEILTALVAEGVISRDTLQKLVGDALIDLFEALCQHSKSFPEAPWLEWCIRNKLARVNHVKASTHVISTLKLNAEKRTACKEAWAFPFAKNLFGQYLVAVLPNNPPPAKLLACFGENPVFCAATFAEFAALRDDFSRVSQELP